MALVLLTGGAYQDFGANPLANGYLTMALSHDEQEPSGPSQVVGGLVLKVPLDGNGNVSGTVNIWPNDVLSPACSYYVVNAYKSDGTQAWKAPQFYTIASSPNPLNLGNIVPNNPPPVCATSGLTLQTNSVNNASQILLNLTNSATVTFTNTGGGTVSAASSGGLPQPDTARFALWEPGLSSSTWFSINDSLGYLDSGAAMALVAPTSTSGLALSVTTNAANPSSWHGFEGFSLFYGVKNLVFKTKGQASNTYGATHIWMGLVTDGNGADIGQVDTPVARSLLMFNKNAASTYWQCVTGDGTNNNVIVTTVPINTTNHKFEIDYTSGVSAVFLIDGVVVATSTTNLPLNSDAMYLWASIGNSAYAAGTFAWEYVYGSSAA